LQLTWHKPSQKDPNQWTESFQYADTAGSSINPSQYPIVLKIKTPQQYLDWMRAVLKVECPSGSMTPINVGDSELLMEMKSGGCTRFGPMDEIDYLRFNENHFFEAPDVELIVYIVKSADMTPAQRQAGISAVTSFASSNAPP